MSSYRMINLAPDIIQESEYEQALLFAVFGTAFQHKETKECRDVILFNEFNEWELIDIEE